MANRDNHYEAALEGYLRFRQIPYVAVDEARRALFAEVALKSLDFIVYSSCGPNLLVDVKGRRFPSGSRGNRRLWENWSTAEDVESLVRWQEVFGSGFRSVLVFAYNVTELRHRALFPGCFEHRGRHYGFVAVPLEPYREQMRVRSARWRTVSVSGQAFREMRRPLHEFL